MQGQKIFLFVAIVLTLLATSVLARPYWSPDLIEDEFVNFTDFAIFAQNWQKSGSGLDGGFDNNGSVDTKSLSE